MKYMIYLFIGLLYFSCKEQNKPQNPPAVKEMKNEANFEWILGNWQRIDDKAGNKTYEAWQKNQAGEYLGLGCRIKGQDTVWKEDILLSRDGEEWNFSVVGLGDSIATVFKLTKINKNGFICENAKNEFPKIIEYAFDGEKINAVISGGGPTIPFTFIRRE